MMQAAGAVAVLWEHDEGAGGAKELGVVAGHQGPAFAHLGAAGSARHCSAGEGRRARELRSEQIC